MLSVALLIVGVVLLCLGIGMMLESIDAGGEDEAWGFCVVLIGVTVAIIGAAGMLP